MSVKNLMLIFLLTVCLIDGFVVNFKSSLVRSNVINKFSSHDYSSRAQGIMPMKTSSYTNQVLDRTDIENNKLTSTRLFTNPRKMDVGINEGTGFAKELLQHNLLSATDEFDLSRQFKVGVHITAQQKKMELELGRPPTDVEVAVSLEITKEKVQVLLDKGEAAKRILVRANMRLVFHLSRYYKYRGVAYPDLVQEGTFGLIKAVDKYDPDKGTSPGKRYQPEIGTI
jgi:DNA-directed RNA polymerase sigma subunit (sigma70/sigma32)